MLKLLFQYLKSQLSIEINLQFGIEFEILICKSEFQSFNCIFTIRIGIVPTSILKLEFQFHNHNFRISVAVSEL